MQPKPQNFRLNATDEKHIKKIMKANGLTTKVSAIRLALTGEVQSIAFSTHASRWEAEASKKENKTLYKKDSK